MHDQLLTITLPTAWAAPPSPWNFSILKDVEECPRRWALFSATYPDVWDGHGYPASLNTKALGGQVIHAVVGSVSLALADAGCTNIRDATATEMLRTMGGFTAILRVTIDRIINRHSTNPRVRGRLDLFRNDLLQDVPAMRQQIQQHLQRISLVEHRSTPIRGAGALGEGSYHELRLRADSLDFVGVVDLLQIERGRCTIWEFKTGSPDDRHVEQLRTYALLWNDDKHHNPNEVPVRRLVLSYAQHAEELRPPDRSELVALRTQLEDRLLGAAASLSTNPPPARPNRAHCIFCGVRHLCLDYWAALPTWHEADLPGCIDVEVRVGAARGPRSWDADLLVAADTARPRPVVLIVASTSPAKPFDSGTRVRLLNVRKHVDNGMTLISISALTEMFRIR